MKWAGRKVRSGFLFFLFSLVPWTDWITDVTSPFKVAALHSSLCQVLIMTLSHLFPSG